MQFLSQRISRFSSTLARALQLVVLTVALALSLVGCDSTGSGGAGDGDDSGPPTGSSPVDGFTSQAAPIVVDGKGDDWAELSERYDDTGDGNIGIERLWMAHTEQHLFLRLRIGQPIDLLEDNNLTLYLDTDNDPTTGKRPSASGPSFSGHSASGQGSSAMGRRSATKILESPPFRPSGLKPLNSPSTGPSSLEEKRSFRAIASGSDSRPKGTACPTKTGALDTGSPPPRSLPTRRQSTVLLRPISGYSPTTYSRTRSSTRGSNPITVAFSAQPTRMSSVSKKWLRQPLRPNRSRKGTSTFQMRGAGPSWAVISCWEAVIPSRPRIRSRDPKELPAGPFFSTLGRPWAKS